MRADYLYWLTPWEPSVLVVCAAFLAITLYIRGCPVARPSCARRACFWLGLLLLYGVSHTQFDYYSEHEFFIHRVQHTVLHHLGPFLVAIARPGAALAAGMPLLWHRRISAGINTAPVRQAIDIANHPVVAAALFCGLILLWLVPSIHFIAMLDWRLYRLMNYGMAVNGLMFWNLALNNYCLRPAHVSPGARIAMMLAVIPPQIIFGMLIFAAPHEIYPLYSLCGRAFSDISPLADQQMGGLILWIPSAMMSVIGIIVVIKKEWMQRDQ